MSDREKKDTSPFVRSQRIERMIIIKEENNPPSDTFDVTVTYPSTDLPEWFAPLQPIVEDETFTSMTIDLGGRTCYKISVEGPVQKYNREMDERNRDLKKYIDKPWLPIYDGE